MNNKDHSTGISNRDSRSRPQSHLAVIELLDSTPGYCTDPVAKCLRDFHAVGGKATKPVQICLLESDTFAAAKRGDVLSARFDSRNAQQGWLRWLKNLSHGTLSDPHEVSVDWVSGIFQQVGTESYGCIADVITCLYESPSGRRRLQPPASATRDPSPSDPEADIQACKAMLDQETPSTREALIQARRGQGKFRNELLGHWGMCAVTKCTLPALLRASHIKPWRLCADSFERLDAYNRFLLTPNLDVAFDLGFISFSDAGCILISKWFRAADAALLGIHAEMKLVCVYQENKPFLAFHRQLHGFEPAPAST